MTTPQEEADRRFVENEPAYSGRGMVSPDVRSLREAFEDGAEWLAAEIGLTPEQVQRLGPLVEAARAYSEAAERTTE